MVSRLSTSRDFNESGSRLNIVAIIYHIINNAISELIMVSMKRRICPGKNISSSNSNAIGKVTVFCLVRRASMANAIDVSVQIIVGNGLGFSRAWMYDAIAAM